MCPDGAVYNIEVDTTHTYLIGDGVVVHNCHHAAAPTYQTVLRKLGCFDRDGDNDHWRGTRAVGFTATLKRGDDVGLGDTWQEVVYTRPLLWMIGKGYLTDVRGVTIQTSVDLGGVKKSGGDYQAKDLGRALMEHEVPAQTAQVIEEYCAQRRPIVFMPDVATAHATVDALERRGISAAAVDGTTGRETRLAIYEQFRRGRIRVLVNCMVLTEGADFPWADCVVVARPTRNEALYIQMVGRGLRPWDGKDDCLVINMAGAGGRLSTLIDLEPGAVDEVRPDETLGEAAVRYAEEQDAVAFDSDNPAFLLRHRDVDLFTASKHAWLRTDGGVMFVPFTGYYFPGAEHGNDRARHGNGYVLLWPEDGTWTVAMAPERGRWHRLHTGLTLGMAQAWAETEAEERNSFNGQKKAGWRRDKPSGPQQRFARGLGINPEGMSRGELSDEISRVQATRLLDPFMRSQEAS